MRRSRRGVRQLPAIARVSHGRELLLLRGLGGARRPGGSCCSRLDAQADPRQLTQRRFTFAALAMGASRVASARCSARLERIEDRGRVVAIHAANHTALLHLIDTLGPPPISSDPACSSAALSLFLLFALLHPPSPTNIFSASHRNTNS